MVIVLCSGIVLCQSQCYMHSVTYSHTCWVVWSSCSSVKTVIRVIQLYGCMVIALCGCVALQL